MFNVLVNSEKTVREFQLTKYSIEISDITQAFFKTQSYIHADVLVIASRYSLNDSNNSEWFIEKATGDGKSVAIVRNIFEFTNYDYKTLSDIRVMEAISNNDLIDRGFIDDINKQYYSEYKTRDRKERVQFFNARIDELAELFPSLIVLDRMDYICEDTHQQCYAIDLKLNKYFYDYGHHTVSGSEFFGARVDQTSWLSEIWDAFEVEEGVAIESESEN